MVDTLRKDAIEYAKRGWKVLPLHSITNGQCSCGNTDCSSPAKHSRIKNWQEKSSTDTSVISEWWEKWPKTNVAIATGQQSGFFVLDIDPRHGGKKSYEMLVKKFGGFPRTLCATSGGGGRHLYFKVPKIAIKNRANILPGLDIKSDNGHIVAPPSIHLSGKNYEWFEGRDKEPIKDAPSWLIDIIVNHKSVKSFVPGNGQCVAEGSRNDFLFREASRLRNAGLSQIQLESQVASINIKACNPPLGDSEVSAICKSASRYVPKVNSAPGFQSKYWEEKPKALNLTNIEAPTMCESLLPESFKPWIMDIVDRLQVAPEFAMAPALVGLSGLVGRKLGILPRKHDTWLVVPNLWGAIVARPGYFKSPTIAEAMAPIELLNEKARAENNAHQFQENAAKMVAEMKLDAIRDGLKKAIKENDQELIEKLQFDASELERTQEESAQKAKRYKTNDATVEKLARLLNENPSGMTLLRDELNGWFQTFNKSGRENDREFYLEAWNGYNSFTVDRVGSGTIHVPALCLSIFGGIQPGKLQNHVEKTVGGGIHNDGLLQRFQLLVYPEVKPTWEDIDRKPDEKALQRVIDIYSAIDSVSYDPQHPIKAVRFSEPAFEVFREWRKDLEVRLRTEYAPSAAFEEHLAKYRSLMPSLALLFWLLEDVNNIHGDGVVSFSAATLAAKWCLFLERHATKVYRIGHSAESLATKQLSDAIRNGLVQHKMSVRSIYRKHWRNLSAPHLVDHALETLEDLNWLKIVSARVQGGSSKRIMIHPDVRNQVGGER